MSIGLQVHIVSKRMALQGQVVSITRLFPNPHLGRNTMARIFLQLVVCAALALPTHAGQGTIQETDTQIIIEYSGGEEDVKAAKAKEDALEIQRQAEQAEIKKKDAENTAQQQKLEDAKRKGALRAQRYGDVK
jgi:hypothetical protein